MLYVYVYSPKSETGIALGNVEIFGTQIDLPKEEDFNKYYRYVPGLSLTITND